MYGFIHCCLEDMVLQLFGEPAWREILNISGIKLRGASFLMHKVYDDEMTFKLVGAASTVSGLPIEVCLEEFGKHFLIYCQKNGYDQILRVLGGNLYDFLTNLDNLHDHLASIYPGMRAPSFRVTHNLGIGDDLGDDKLATNKVPHQQQQQQQHTYENPSNVAKEIDPNGNGNGDINASMYLHYYSERTSLSPIVKGLVMAVAREFFDTDIVVTECESAKPRSRKSSMDQDEEPTSGEHGDDHVVFKIDRRAVQLAPVEEQAADSVGAERERSPEVDESSSKVNKTLDAAMHQLGQQQVQSTAKMLELSGSLSASAKDSLVNSEIMMQTFPFHVIFDRQFNIVQVGKSLLRVTSLYWKSRSRADDEDEEPVKFSDLFQIVRPKIEFTFDAIADHTNQVFVVKTKPLVLNADQRRQSMSSLAAASAVAPTAQRASESLQVAGSNARRTSKRMSMCPMDRIAREHRRMSAAVGRSGGANQTAGLRRQDSANGAAVAETNETTGGENEEEDEEEAGNRDEPDDRQPLNGHHSAHGNHDDPMDAQNPYLSLRLKGQMIILSNQSSELPLCLYLCSPRVDHIDQLLDVGVNMSDFALYDRARELMLMSHTHKEDRENVKKLDQATNDLKKMDTKLRAENKRTNEVLHNIFPAKIATLLSHGHKIDSESFDPVTCLYSDIIGFTKMCGSENVRPIDIVRLLNTLYLQFDNLTNIHGVFKVETIGDAYVVVGGLPEPAEDHADRCVKMGLDMVKVIATVRSPADNQPIQMRIGIHSGPVMAGIVGIRVPRYSLFGNTTTLANQLETNGVGGKIHISDFTLKQLIKRDRFVLEDNPNEIPGFPFKTYFVTNYIGDESETLKYEKILEEQLIKDLELMGQEVEFVDDSGANCDLSQQLAAISSGQQPAGWPTLAASSSAAIATASGATSSAGQSAGEPSGGGGGGAKANVCASEELEQNRKPARRKLLSETLVASSSESNDSFAATADSTTTINNNNLQDRARTTNANTATTKTAKSSRRPTDLLLMDIEDGDGTRRRRKVNGNNGMPQKFGESLEQIRQVAYQLSDSILADAIKIIPPTGVMLPRGQSDQQKQKQKEQQQNGDRTARLLAVLADRQADLELVLRKQVAADKELGSCPLCDGFGSLDNVKSLLRFRIPVDLLNLNSNDNNNRTISGSDNNNGNDTQESRHLILDFDRQFGVAMSSSDNNDKNPNDAINNLSRHQKLKVGQLLTRVANQLASGEGQPAEPEASQLLGNRKRRQSIEQLIGELRSERLRLDEKIKEMKQQQQLHGKLPVVPPAPRPQQPPPQVPAHKPASSRSIITAARGQLSSNIQRMKRMDTLKRRKIKREQQQQESPALTSGQSSLDFNEAAENLSSIRFARVRLGSQNMSNDLEDEEDEECEEEVSELDSSSINNRAKQNSSSNNNSSSSNTNHNHKSVIAEESIAEELSSNDELPAQHQQSTATTFKQEVGGFFRRKFSRTGQESSSPVGRKLSFATSASPSGGDRGASGRQQPEAPAKSSSSNNDKTPTRRATTTNEPTNATGAGYSYQTFRASLANLMSEAANVRPKFSLANAFANLSASSSPVKKPFGADKSQKGAPTSRTQSQESRKQSSRSHSSSSGCGLATSSASPKTGGGAVGQAGSTSGYHNSNSNKHADNGGGGRSSNCSCLRSSASSQSFESINE